MQNREIGPAPNYTNAALTMMGVNLLWIFMAVWAVFGLIPVLVLGAVLNHMITLLAARRR